MVYDKDCKEELEKIRKLLEEIVERLPPKKEKSDFKWGEWK